MNYLNLINTQIEEISAIYSVLSGIMDNAEQEQDNSDKRTWEIIQNTNKNVSVINQRLKQMDYDIEESDRKLTEKIEAKIISNNHNATIQKEILDKKLVTLQERTHKEFVFTKINVGKLDKRLVGIQEETSNSLLLLNTNNINNNKELEMKLINIHKEFTDYKKSVESRFEALKRELRITRNMKIEKIKGVSIK